MSTSTMPFHLRKHEPKPLATETDRKFVQVKPKYNISDQPTITKELKALKVGDSITYEDISGSLLINIMDEFRNYNFELIDSFGVPATMCIEGRNIYVAATGHFRHAHTYHTFSVRATSGKSRSNWSRVFNSYDWLDNKSVFGTVKITRMPFWYRSKAPRVD